MLSVSTAMTRGREGNNNIMFSMYYVTVYYRNELRIILTKFYILNFGPNTIVQLFNLHKPYSGLRHIRLHANNIRTNGIMYKYLLTYIFLNTRDHKVQ